MGNKTENEGKVIIEHMFEKLQKDGDYGWCGEQTLEFGGNACTVELLIHNGGEDDITPMQKEAFQCFIEKWPQMQEELIEALIKYYNEEERFSYGPDDPEEFEQWWPEIETKEALLQVVTLEGLVIAWDSVMRRKGRCIYLLFSRAWGGEDDDDNGIGVRYIDEEIDEIAYKDMAF